MSNAPYLLPKVREGLRMGHGQVIDSMIHDGLWDPYGDKHMGNCAELCAREYAFSREAQDEFSRESYARARAAQDSGAFAAEAYAGAGRTAPPLLLPYYMLQKLFNKDVVLAHGASSLFRAAPFIIFGCMVLACAIVPTLSTDLPFAPAADALALVGVFGLARISALVFAHSASSGSRISGSMSLAMVPVTPASTVRSTSWGLAPTTLARARAVLILILEASSSTQKAYRPT